MEEGKEASSAPGLSGTCAACWVSLVQLWPLPVSLLWEGAQAWPRGWVPQDPFPASTKCHSIWLFHAELSSSAVPTALCFHAAFQSMQSQAVKMPLQWVLAKPSYFLWYFEPNSFPLSPDNHDLGHGVTTGGPEDIQGQMLCTMDEAWPGVGSRPREQALSLMSVTV